MADFSFAHLELLAEVDTLLADLRAWIARALDWPPARACVARVTRLAERAAALCVRLDAPLVVATLGGTGTGKSSLVNALAGDDVTEAGRQRPTTCKPVLICRPDLSPEALGIPRNSVHLVQRELPALRDLVILDCPDPDTTENEQEGGTNLARLRELLPHCDVLLVTSTQQKYRSARVKAELLSATVGASVVFVQTHGDIDEDVRGDWRRVLCEDFEPGEMFFVDSLTALADARAGLAPRGEFARLLDLLSRELSGTAAHRIRRANFLDLVEDTLAACGQMIAAEMPAVEALDAALTEQRRCLTQKLAHEMQSDLLASRRHWENRLLSEAASQWGLSPFSLVLRLYQGLGSLVAGATLWRMRTPAQLAIWGVVQGGRKLKSGRQAKAAEDVGARAVAWTWDEAELRRAAIILDGYAAEAGLPREGLNQDVVAAEAAAASETFVESVGGQIQRRIHDLARRNTGWFTRLRYELALLVVVGGILYRLGKNFFYDSWLAVDLGRAEVAQPVLGLDFFVQAGFWLLLWCLLLVWLFTARLRRGLKQEIASLAQSWSTTSAAGELFAGLQRDATSVRSFSEEHRRLQNQTAHLRRQLETPSPHVGRKRS